MNPLEYIADAARRCVTALYGVEPAPGLIQVQPTRKEFEGDVTLVVFPLLKTSHKAPEATATEIGAWLQENDSQVAAFNVVKGFLNIKISGAYWASNLAKIAAQPDFGQLPASGKTVMVEFSSRTPTSRSIWDISATTCWAGR